MSVRAKFRCLSIAHAFTGNPDQTFTTVTLAPVWEQDGVNKSWSQATPQGKIEMSITNPAAVDQFDIGKEYLVDFTPAD